MYMGSNLHSNLIDFCATVSYLSSAGSSTLAHKAVEIKKRLRMPFPFFDLCSNGTQKATKARATAASARVEPGIFLFFCSCFAVWVLLCRGEEKNKSITRRRQKNEEECWSKNCCGRAAVGAIEGHFVTHSALRLSFREEMFSGNIALLSCSAVAGYF